MIPDSPFTDELTIRGKTLAVLAKTLPHAALKGDAAALLELANILEATATRAREIAFILSPPSTKA